MRVIEEPFQLVLPRDGNRSDGLHLSTVIRDLALTVGVLDKKYDVSIDESDTTVMQVGLAWEDYLAHYQHPEIDFHPGELRKDGIAMSPDGIGCSYPDEYATLIGVEPGTWLLHEFKFTLKSSRDFKESIRLRAKKVLMWLWQIMSYRLALNDSLAEVGEAGCNIAKLHVLFIKGDYDREQAKKDPDSLAKYQIFRLHFTDEELLENWKMIVNHAREMEKAGKCQIVL